MSDDPSLVAAVPGASAAPPRPGEAGYRELVEQAEDMIYRVSLSGHFTYVNPAAGRIMGYPTDAIVGKHFTELVRQDHRDALMELYARQVAEATPSTYAEFPTLTAGGREVWVAQNVQLLLEGDRAVALQAVARDITDRKRVEEDLRRHLELERMVGEEAARLINTPWEELDRAIDEVLGALGSFLETDRVRVFVFDRLAEHVTNSHEWCADGVASRLEEIMHRPVADLRWWMGRLHRLEPVVINRVGDLPAEAVAERALLAAEGIRSLVNVPMRAGSRLVGSLGCDLLAEERDWPEQTVWTLGVLGAVIAGALLRRETYRALGESEARFRTALVHAPIGVALVDRDGRFMQVNRSLCRIVGYEEDELLGLTFQEITHPDDLDEDLALVRRLLAGEIVSYEMEKRYLHKLGHPVRILLTGSVVRDEDGEPLYFVAQIQDITERKQAEEALRASETRYRTLVETANEGIWVIDRDGRTEFVNGPMGEMLGYALSEMLGRSLLEFMDEESRREALHYLGRREQGIREVHEFLFRRKDGSDLVALVSTSPLYAEDGSYTGALGLVKDITQRKRVERELEAARAAAEKASRAKSDFVAMMSHEIRTPVNVILGTTELLLEGPLQEEQKELAETVERNAASLLVLLNDFLDFARIEAARLHLEEVPYEPAALVRGVAATLSRAAAARGSRLLTEVDPSVPPRLRGDPGRVRQVLLNLASNAVKATEGGEIRVRVEAVPTAGEPGALELHLTVADTGMGIAPADLERVFDRFTQAGERPGRHPGGTGLGLSISRSLVELMGGSIRAESVPGLGSTFHVSLPLIPVAPGNGLPTPEDDSAAAVRNAALPGPWPAYEPERPIILVVEDHADNRRLAARFLSDAGFQVEMAVNGTDALERVASFIYDLVIMDLELPGMDGLEAARAIRVLEENEGRQRVPIVAWTAHAVEGYRERCLASGMDDFAAKPVNRHGLLRIANNWADVRPVVLLADDSGEARTLLQRYLRKEPYRLVLAANGRQAVEAFQRQRVSLAVLDIDMPVLDGQDAARAIRALPRGAAVPLIALTGSSTPEDEAECVRVGFTRVLRKPVSRRQLLDVLRAALRPPHHARSAPPPRQPPGPADTVAEDSIADDTTREDPVVADLIPGYLEHRREDVQRIRDLVADGQIPQVQRLAHNMKSSGPAYGFSEIGTIGGEMERAAAAGDVERIAELNDRLEGWLAGLVARSG
jgi:PAS domain S-box-containing protein